MPGVREVQANPLTGNILVHFDPQRISEERVLAVLGGSQPFRQHAGACGPGEGGKAVLRAGLRGLLGHAVVDTLFYTVAFTEPFGLPLAGLGVLHLGLDVFVWGAALAPLLAERRAGEPGLRTSRSANSSSSFVNAVSPA
jgi:hypothetical protein